MLVPLAPLVVVPGITEPDRYLLVPWAGLSFALPYLFARFCDATVISWWAPKVAGIFALIALVCISLYNSRQYLIRVINPVAREFDAHAKFLLSHDNKSSYIPGPSVISNFWFVNGIKEILPHIDASKELPVAIVDPFWLSSNQTSVFTYSRDCECMAQASDVITMHYASHNASVQEQPLRIELQFGLDFLSWELGPYLEGEYRLVSGNIGSILLPPTGLSPTTLQSLKLLEAPFILKYASPEGWITYSPELTLAILSDANSAHLSWGRE